MDLKFRAFTAVLLNIQIFWDVTLRRWYSSSRTFKLSLCIHLQSG